MSTGDPRISVRAPGAPPVLALGAMNFGKRVDAAGSARIVARALERGIGLVDTANAYNDGESERIVGELLAPYEGRAWIATKVGFGRVNGKLEGLSGATVRRAADESRARLGVDAIDLYYLHVPDHRTPIEETLDAVADLFERGIVRHWGVSNYASWQILEMMPLAQARGLPRPAVSQVLYNALIRQIEVEYVRFVRHVGLHTTVYNALAGGLLTGRYGPGAAIPSGSRFDGNAFYQRRYFSDRMLREADELCTAAREAGIEPAVMAYRWLAGRGGVDSILVGPTSVEQLDLAIDACAAPPLPEDLVARLDAIHRSHEGTDAVYAR